MTVELSFEENIFPLKNGLDEQNCEKTPEWQQRALDLILQSGSTVPEIEFDRLKRLNIIDLTQENQLDFAIQTVAHSAKDNRPILKVMMAKALAIQKIYHETHHVFIP
ncbi:MAG TPA: hypothetical protein VLE96_03690 [Chlamydiales bacterium]|nr:hypothetical protein [Chlamydiales bacterium]